MLPFVLVRMLWAIPTLLLIALLSFLITQWAPGDPITRMMSGAAASDEAVDQWLLDKEQRAEWARRLGIDLPVFYVQVLPLAFPDTLHRIYDHAERKAAHYWLLRSGDAEAVHRYRKAIYQLGWKCTEARVVLSATQPVNHDLINQVIQVERLLHQLLISADATTSQQIVLKIETIVRQHLPAFVAAWDSLEAATLFLWQRRMPWKSYVPSLRFHLNNQFHRWLFGDRFRGEEGVYSKGILRGDFGISLSTHRPVADILRSSFFWSFTLVALSTLFAFLISIPIGVRAAVRQGSFFDSLSATVLLLLHSMPLFWMALLLVLLLANPNVLAWFPASGVQPPTGYPPGSSWWQKVGITLPYMVLPLTAATLGSLAWLSRLTRNTMVDILRQDYIRTAYAKGLLPGRVVWAHGFRNAWLPLITVLAQTLPAAVGGSIVLETIFSIPGMGWEVVYAVSAKDYTLLAGIFFLMGCFVVAGYLVADILYAVADPRIQFQHR